jgi:hypothetical protein
MPATLRTVMMILTIVSYHVLNVIKLNTVTNELPKFMKLRRGTAAAAKLRARSYIHTSTHTNIALYTDTNTCVHYIDARTHTNIYVQL